MWLLRPAEPLCPDLSQQGRVMQPGEARFGTAVARFHRHELARFVDDWYIKFGVPTLNFVMRLTRTTILSTIPLRVRRRDTCMYLQAVLVATNQRTWSVLEDAYGGLAR